MEGLFFSAYRMLTLLLLFCTVSEVYAAKKIQVFVSILPQKYLVEQVGGELVDVNVMIGPGQNPATYEPTPKQMAAITNADIYFTIDVPFENAWMKRISSNSPGMRVVPCCEDIVETKHVLLHDDHTHEHGGHDSHIWTSPNNVKLLINLIAKELSILDGENNAYYENAANTFIEKLQKLDNGIKEKTASLGKRQLIVSHPSWSYFALDYGFEQITIEQNGKEIKAASLKALIDMARENNIKAVFTQPQFNDKAAKIIARELNAEVIVLDPLAYDYIDNMTQTTDKIVKGLSHE